MASACTRDGVRGDLGKGNEAGASALAFSVDSLVNVYMSTGCVEEVNPALWKGNGTHELELEEVEKNYRNAIESIESACKAWTKVIFPGISAGMLMHSNYRGVVKSEPTRLEVIRVQEENDEVALTITSLEGSFETVNEEEQMFFNDSEGVTRAAVRFNSPEADSVSGEGWSGFMATVLCPADDEFGVSSAGGECFRSLISNFSRSLILETNGRSGLDSLLWPTILSIEFMD